MNKEEAREQIQEDILTYIDGKSTIAAYACDEIVYDLCQIVVDNFKNLEE